MKESYLTTLRLAQNESAPASPQTDFVKDAAGNMQVVTPTGPQQVATTQTVTSAVAARLKKVQLTGTGAVAITSASLAFTEGQSMLLMCLSGGPLVDAQFRLHP